MRKLGAAILTLGLVVVGLAVPATAQAEESGVVGADRVLTAPAAPVGTQGVGAMATSPRISPSASYVHVAPGSSYTCKYGNLCTQVWDPVYSKWKVFSLYYCNTYSLSYWNGYGAYINNQTTGTKSYFYNSSGGVIRTSTAYGYDTSYDWTPVWKIKNC
jgi:hypothetical protein